MSIKIDNVPQIPPKATCTICRYRLFSKKWKGKNNVIVIAHNSSSKPCHFHENCARAWVGRHGEVSNACTQCTKPMSDVVFYKRNTSGIYEQVVRDPLHVYEPPENKDLVLIALHELAESRALSLNLISKVVSGILALAIIYTYTPNK